MTGRKEMSIEEMYAALASALTQLGGQMPTEEAEEEPEKLSWYERLGNFSGEVDAYKKEMGIQNRPMQQQQQLPALPQGRGMSDLTQMMAMAQRGGQQRQRRPRMNMQDMMTSGHLKTLMGG